MSDDVALPAGWSSRPLSDAADATLGKTPRRIDYRSEGSHRLVKYRDLKTGAIDFSETKDAYVADDPEVLRGLRELKVGDVLIGASGHDGSTVGRKLALVDELPSSEEVFFVGELFRIRPRGSDSDPRWFLHYFSSEAGYEALQSAVTGGHLTNGRARQIIVPTAPLGVQKQISDILDTVRSKERSATHRLASVRRLVDRFRQAVLAAACSGRLTSDWRTDNGITDDPTDDLAAEWSWRTLDDLGKWRTGGTPSRRRPEYFGGEIPWVKSGDLRDGPVTTTEERLTPEALQNSSAKLMPVGTVSIALYGATIGRLGVLEIEAATNQACANCVPDIDVVDRWFLFYYLLGQRPRFVAAGQGGAQPNLTNRIVRDWPIALPPIAEQREIVRRVDQLLATADGLTKRIDSASRGISRSSQAVLAKAFRGDLISSSDAALPTGEELFS